MATTGELQGKVAIVTGGSRGIGRSMSLAFAAAGAQVIVAARTENEAAPDSPFYQYGSGNINDTARQIAEAGGEAMVAMLDVSQEDQWERAVADVVAKFGKLDILVNNAGISGSGVKDFGDTAAWDHLMDINAKSVFLGMKHAIPEMEKVGGGAIVNISSISGMVGQSYVHPGYNASKGAVHIMTKSLAVQHAASSIRVNSVHPGPIQTDMTRESWTDPETKERTQRVVPLGRYGQPIDVANAVLFLASDEADYITGAEIVVDGGYTAQ